MKDFNWESFVNGEFAVNVKDMEDMEKFTLECLKYGIEWFDGGFSEKRWDDYKELTCCRIVDGIMWYSGKEYYLHRGIKAIEWRSDNMKNFREVIRDIKEGEVWESENFEILIDDEKDFHINSKYGFTDRDCGIWFNNEKGFKLKQQSVTFEEVLNSNKNCRVEHLFNDGTKITYEYDSLDNVMYLLARKFEESELKEIIKNGKWYLEP